MLTDDCICQLRNEHPDMLLNDEGVIAFARAIEAECRKVPAGYVLVPVEPTEPMLEAALHAGMQHLIDCINDPARADEVGSEEMCRLTYRSRYKSMLAAAPKPAEPGHTEQHLEMVGPNVPFPGMQEEFEAYYSQSFTDRDWRREAGVWAAAWKSAIRHTKKAEPVAQEPVAYAVSYDGKTPAHDCLPARFEDTLPRLRSIVKRVGGTAQIIALHLGPQPDQSAEVERLRKLASLFNSRFDDDQKRIKELERQQAVLVEALEYHQKLTRPIQSTIDALASVKGVTFPPCPGHSVPADLKITKE